MPSTQLQIEKPKLYIIIMIEDEADIIYNIYSDVRVKSNCEYIYIY